MRKLSARYLAAMDAMEKQQKREKIIEQMTENTMRVCKECGRKMIAKEGKYGFFFGCSGYPRCKYTEKV